MLKSVLYMYIASDIKQDGIKRNHADIAEGKSFV